MLVLSRKKNESIVINDDVTIVVVEIRGDKVRLGVEAPMEVPVHRKEVYNAIKREEEIQRNITDKSLEKVVSTVSDETSLQFQGYSDFRSYLDQGKYLEAYDISLGIPNLLGREDLVNLSRGLGETSKSLNSKLQNYEGVKWQNKKQKEN